MLQYGAFTILVNKTDKGKRLDVVIASYLSDCSRSFAANLINDHKIQVGGQNKKPGYRVRAGDQIRGQIPAPQPLDFKPEPIGIDILYQDDHLIVINKAPGLVVHPAPGHYSGTLVNALLYHCPDLEGIGGKLRPGIVHRLDKDTSGALVVAKTASAHEHLAKQFKTRNIHKKYLVLVFGEFDSNKGTIILSIGRHPIDRKRMSTRSRKRREAETQWQVRERFQGVTLLELNLKTGRTHQIRVHCAAINHPVVGDPVYCPHKLLKNITKNFSSIPPAIADALQSVKRQMLHAWRLGFTHPQNGQKVVFEAPLPKDMKELLNKLRGVT
ncbi:MAG: RluA family pseudouridine synthase [Desulfobacterales bacterium]|nr:MAG: RluA family pseudouridine synthase [Desulfobacterales bacterium]